MLEFLQGAVGRAAQHHRLGRHRRRQDDAAEHPLQLHLRRRAHRHDRGRRRADAAAAPRRPAGDAAAEHRRQGRGQAAAAGDQRPAYAARSHHRRRGPRRRSARHAAGHEHRPRRQLDDHPRQQPARRAVPPRHDGRDGQPEHPGHGRAPADRLGRQPDRPGHPPVRRHAQGHRRSPRSPAWSRTSSPCRTSSCSSRPASTETARSSARSAPPASGRSAPSGWRPPGFPLPMDMFEHVQQVGRRRRRARGGCDDSALSRSRSCFGVVLGAYWLFVAPARAARRHARCRRRLKPRARAMRRPPADGCSKTSRR